MDRNELEKLLRRGENTPMFHCSRASSTRKNKELPKKNGCLVLASICSAVVILIVCILG
jgi:hypothetical protein